METEKYIDFSEKIPVYPEHDVIVCGGGVAGVAAAVNAARHGKSVILFEKSLTFGGLATNGLINMFVPSCNGRGVNIIKGMNAELFDLAVKYSYDTIPDKWKNDEPDKGGQRYMTTYSPCIFALVLTEFLEQNGVKIMLDCVVSDVICEKNDDTEHCKGVVVQTKGGRKYYPAKIIIDTTGDADVLYKAGVPCIDGKNYYTFSTYKIDIDSCKKAAESGNIRDAYKRASGGDIDLYGHNQPADKPLYVGVTSEDVTDYIMSNHHDLLEKLKADERSSRDIIQMPIMPQFRTTRCIKGEHIFSEKDAYKHFDDSIAAICDFDHRDFLFEVPFGCLVNHGFDNIITAGRSAAASGYGWDILRVIPPAIITGQAAGTAASMAIENECDINKISIKDLQKTLEDENVMIHFDDEWIPSGEATDVGERVDNGHF